MLATILRSEQADEATISIIETFTQLRVLQQTINQAVLVEEEKEKKSLLAQGGALMADLLDTQLQESESETHVELNFAVLKLKHIRKSKKRLEINLGYESQKHVVTLERFQKTLALLLWLLLLNNHCGGNCDTEHQNQFLLAH